MFNRKTGEWAFLLIFLIINITILIKADNWNRSSFDEISKIIYGVISEIANVRTSPNIDSKIKFTMKKNDAINILKKKGNWQKIIHQDSLKEGWAHKSTLRRYLHLGYYRTYRIKESLIPLMWE